METKEALKGGPLVGREMYEHTGLEVFVLGDIVEQAQHVFVRYGERLVSVPFGALSH